MKAKLLTPLLPPGGRISSQSKDPLPNHSRLQCELRVDGKEVFIASQEWGEKRKDAFWVARFKSAIDDEALDGSSDFQYAQKGAALRVNCAHPKKSNQDIFAVAVLSGPQEPDVDDVKAFTKNYAKGIARSKQCAESSSK